MQPIDIMLDFQEVMDAAGDDPDVTDDNWTEDVKKNFSGRIIVAKDLMQLALPV